MSDPGGVAPDGASLALPAPGTRLLVDAVFPERERARQWLERPNPALGCAPLQLIAQGRERELQRYLSSLLAPAEAPPPPFDSLFRPQERPPV